MFFKIPERIRKKLLYLILLVFGVLVVYLLRGLFPTILLPADRLLSYTVEFSKQLYLCVSGRDDLLQQNKKLSLQLQELKLQITELEYIKKENEILREYLKFKTDYGINKFLIAKVVGFSANSWLSSFRIDAGQKDGVRRGDLVVYDGFLVGIVDVVYPESSVVLTVGDKNFRITVRTRKTGELCLYQGFDDRSGYLKYVRPEQDIRVGDVVMTDAVSGNIPAGIPVGMVKHISQKEGEFFRSVEISLFYRQSILDYVMVVSR